MSNLYIPKIGLPILLQTDPWEYINHSPIHECRNWERGRGIFISGNTYIGFSVQCTLRVGVPEHGGRPSVGRGDEQHVNPTWQ